MFIQFRSGPFSRRSAGALLLVGVLAGVAVVGVVSAAPSTTVKWKVSSLTAGKVVKLSSLVSTNSTGLKTWSKRGSCTLMPKDKPTMLKMGSGKTCLLTLKIAKTNKYPAKISSRTIVLAKPTTTTVAPTTTTTTVAPTCAPLISVCAVGDTGPGGGIVFYVASSPFTQTGATGSMCTNACKYLEAAPTNWLSDAGDPTRTWSAVANQETAVTGADATDIGSGYQNSLDIVAQSGNEPASSAAVLARNYTTGSKSDWFLPSNLELNELCKYARTQTTGDTSVACASSGTLRAGFAAGGYRSSSEGLAFTAWYQRFNYGDQFNVNKDATFYVRPVRAF